MSFAIAIDPAEDAPLVAGVDGARLRAELEALLADGKREHGALLKHLRAWLARHQERAAARSSRPTTTPRRWSTAAAA